MIELKPCPFCGGEAKRGVARMNANPRHFTCVAYCVNCLAEIRMHYVVGAAIKNPESEAKRYIARMWNRRAGNGGIH